MDKKDLLEARKLFTGKRMSVSRIAGVYMDADHKVISSFSNYTGAMDEDSARLLLALSKKGMSGKLVKNQVSIAFSNQDEAPGGRQDALMKLLKSGCADQNLLVEFCSIFSDIPFETEMLILFAYGDYDVPSKAKDGTELEGSADVYSFIHIDFCPVERRKNCAVFDAASGGFTMPAEQMEAKAPICGLLFPAFTDRQSDIHNALYYVKSEKERHPEIAEILTGAGTLPMGEQEQRSVFAGTVEEAFGRGCNFESVRDAALAIGDLARENPDAAAQTGAAEMKRILSDTAAGKERGDDIEQAVKETFGDGTTLNAEAVAQGNITIESPLLRLSVRRDTAGLLETRIVEGRECILIPVENGLTLDGIRVLPAAVKE